MGLTRGLRALVSLPCGRGEGGAPGVAVVAVVAEGEGAGWGFGEADLDVPGVWGGTFVGRDRMRAVSS